MIRRRWHTTVRGWTLLLFIIGVTPHAAWAAAHEGLDRWFTCGIVFWGPCEPEVENEQSQQTPRTEESSKGLSRDVLQMWGTPVAGPDGSVSYQLPPEPVLKMFVTPSEETARTYLAWQQQKARNREAAFAAIRRVAAEIGYTVGQPSVTPDLSAAALGTIGGSMMNPLPDPHAMPRELLRPDETAPTVTPVSRQHAAVAERPATALPRPATVSPTTAPRLYYFFSPTCPYCEQQTPLVNEIVKGRHDVVGIAMATTRDEVMAYVQHWKITFPVMLDHGESATFGVTGYPVVVARDREGQVKRLTGLARREELQRLVADSQ
jgi:thiol-disulfide isomerase/thioredoxin